MEALTARIRWNISSPVQSPTISKHERLSTNTKHQAKDAEAVASLVSLAKNAETAA